MSSQTSSAEPTKLHVYADWGMQCNSELQSTASTLYSSLSSFQSTCTEVGFRVSTDHCVPQLNSHLVTCGQYDLWVGNVAKGFFWADSPDALFWLCFANGWSPAYLASSGQDGLQDSEKRSTRGYTTLDTLETVVAGLKYSLLHPDLRGISEFADQGNEAREAIATLLKINKEYKVGLISARKQGGFIGAGSWQLRSDLGWTKYDGLLSDALDESDSYLTHQATKDIRNLNFSGLNQLDTSVGLLSVRTGLDTFTEQLKPSTGLGWGLMALQIGFIGHDNWQEYKDVDSSKVVTGTIVDSSIKLACGAVGAGVGAAAGGFLLGSALGAASGGVLAPVGVAIGSRVGGFLGGMFGDYIGDKILETNVDERMTDLLDQGVDAAIEGVQYAADKIDDAFDSAISSVVSFFD